ncbi:hypothetical protein BJ878DRAFT_501243 [Calycina marina]|uniref:Zn(2)-C6 fungal-type domain-containing protein n=1 Tax=Calycina marina TaxID=1763456 RepID=A0A9P8CG52_9HELO|nr:hypothetical protein BJ878DRAFT_501243 [Calycina marina]
MEWPQDANAEPQNLTKGLGPRLLAFKERHDVGQASSGLGDTLSLHKSSEDQTHETDMVLSLTFLDNTRLKSSGSSFNMSHAPLHTPKGRKGHTKSRRGCFNCKKARIKCKENRPSCDYCSHRGLQCEWPELQISMVRQSESNIQGRQPGVVTRTSPSLTIGPVTKEPVFNMQDFRLFNHFLKAAYPHHPVGNDSVWTHEIPSLASEYDFLLHAMLALSASDIANSRGCSQDQALQLNSTALSYRVKAITALNKAMDSPSRSFEQGNAMLGACFALLFQSILMENGLVEYMSFIRGVIAVSIHMGMSKLRFLFENMFNQTEMIQSNLQDMDLVNPDLASGACRSIERFGHLVVNPRELEYYGYLLSAARSLFTSSAEAYGNLSKIYGLFCYTMSHAEYSAFIASTNEVGKLLQSHFAALQLIMMPITLSEQALVREPRNETSPGAGTTTRWLTSLHRRIVPGMMAYYEWPLLIERGVHEGWVPFSFA